MALLENRHWVFPFLSNILSGNEITKLRDIRDLGAAKQLQASNEVALFVDSNGIQDVFAPLSGKVVDFVMASDRGAKTVLIQSETPSGLRIFNRLEGIDRPIRKGDKVTQGQFLGKIESRDKTLRWSAWINAPDLLGREGMWVNPVALAKLNFAGIQFPDLNPGPEFLDKPSVPSTPSAPVEASQAPPSSGLGVLLLLGAGAYLFFKKKGRQK